jgi:hypothetical protein
MGIEEIIDACEEAHMLVDLIIGRDIDHGIARRVETRRRIGIVPIVIIDPIADDEQSR